jgi:hypothetical protein
MAKAKAKENVGSSGPPKGMRTIEGGYAKSWDIEEMPVIDGRVESAIKTVTLTQKRNGKTESVDRQCVEVKTSDGERYTVWESATLANLFSALEQAIPCSVWIKFTGYGKAKRGQNPPKLFESAIGD